MILGKCKWFRTIVDIRDRIRDKDVWDNRYVDVICGSIGFLKVVVKV